MKLILILIVLAATTVVTHADPPLVFETNFTCSHVHGKWCVFIYYFELDSSSSHDPILYFRFCTRNRTKTVAIPSDPIGGDGGMYGLFQNFYELGYAVFHSCTDDSSFTCFTNRKFKYIPYDTEEVQIVRENFFFSTSPFGWKHKNCAIPEAFQNLRRYYIDQPQSSPYNFYSIHLDEVEYWTPTTSGSFMVFNNDD